MFHTKFPQACLLCHLAVQLDEHVATTLGDARQPLFDLYKNVYCQRPMCWLCVSGQGEGSYCIHRECYRYYRIFFPKSSLRLRDLLELWPRTLDFLGYRISDREKHAYSKYFADMTYRPVGDVTENNFMNFLRSMTNKLPAELLSYIAELSWPCALQKPVTILREERSLQEFWARKKQNKNYILEYTGEAVSVTYLNFLGFAYVTSLRMEEKPTVCPRDDLSIAVTRDNMAILDVDFQGKFRFKRRGCWYKVIRTSKDHLQLRVCVKNIVTDFDLANVESPWNPYWDVPLVRPPTVSIWYISSRGVPDPNFMRYVEIRNDTQGIIVSCAHDGIISISTHARSRKPIFDEEEGVNPNYAVRIYFPLAKNEIILSAWVRELNAGWSICYPAIVVRYFIPLITAS
ncbi:hypothetical protein DM02DRAFT_659961 [Periconia macrospinosa]|uniref:Uncharacterized protein n=1 Tax=Periconia macrospinosa TaxID=97972 RepID=A0A2V1DCB9_9PLEO|nr:hypothetical protein DM02DRAFT_659961 [Periconia macrospinosa]